MPSKRALGWRSTGRHPNSGRSARRGKYKGYYFVRGDYVRLKVLTFTVHRDAVKALLATFAAEPVDGGVPAAKGSL